MHDVIIVGAGPAGLAAAAYCLRKRLDILVIAPDLGGKATTHQVGEAVRGQIAALGQS